MRVYVFIALFFCSCLNLTPNDKVKKVEEVTQISSVLEPKPAPMRQDSTSFAYFEHLVKSEEGLPSSIAMRFLFSMDTSLSLPGAYAIGKGVSYRNQYKRFKLLVGHEGQGYILIINYGLNNRLIDYAKFMYYCHSCSPDLLWADVQEGKNKVTVRYFDPISGKSMPSERDKTVRKIETWTISQRGEMKVSTSRRPIPKR